MTLHIPFQQILGSKAWALPKQAWCWCLVHRAGGGCAPVLSPPAYAPGPPPAALSVLCCFPSHMACLLVTQWPGLPLPAYRQGPSLLGPSVLGHCAINLFLADTPIICCFGAPVPFPPKTGRVLTVSGCLWALQTDRTVLPIHPTSWWLFDLMSIWHLCMVTPEGQLADDSRLVPSTPPSFW